MSLHQFNHREQRLVALCQELTRIVSPLKDKTELVYHLTHRAQRTGDPSAVDLSIHYLRILSAPDG